VLSVFRPELPTCVLELIRMGGVPSFLSGLNRWVSIDEGYEGVCQMARA